jgi:hypothetical protein
MVNVEFVVKHIIGAFGLAVHHQPATHNDVAFGKADRFANFRHGTPAGLSVEGVMNLAQMSRSLRSFLFI